MITREEIDSAAEYNAKKGGKLWNRSDLPFPLNDSKLSWTEFVAWVCAFQIKKNISLDGKLGPKTFEEIRVRDIIDDGGPSNTLIIAGKRVRLPDDMIIKGYTAKNFLDDGLEKFSLMKRGGYPSHFVLHETCGNSVSGCVSTLRKKNYGVQFVQDHNGCFYQYGDPVWDRMVHANQLNGSSFGCEQINPYNPIYISNPKIWHQTMPSKWWTWVPSKKSENIQKILKNKGLTYVPKEYVMLTHNQVESMKIFAPWICEQTGVPYVFPSSGVKKKINYPSKGIVAHRDFASHSDGRYMLEILIKESTK